MVKTLIFLSLIGLCLTVKSLPIDENETAVNYNAALIAAIGIEAGTIQIAENDGYPIEEHYVKTADQYILKMHRIPYGVHSPPAANKPVVFLQHGLLCSSADWIVLGPERAVAYLLVDRGFDVWLGNARGNTNSRRHEFLDPSSKAFWDFSWHEIGQFDLPAMIDNALEVTGQKDLHYIGHSQGTTTFFVMGSVRPEYNKKIRTMHALAPVAFMSNLKSPFIKMISPFVDEVDWLTKMMGLYEFMPSTELMSVGGGLVCKNESPIQAICANVLFLLCGFNSQQLNRTIIPAVLQQTPAGASTNQLVHYGQGVNSGRFRMYDHGLISNYNRYGAFSPPDYQLSRVTAPVFLHYTDNDWMAAVKDVEELAGKLGNLVGKFRVSDPSIIWISPTPLMLKLYCTIVLLV